MKINTKGRIAIAAMLDIALHGTNKPVRLADIGQRQGVSISHLEHLFRKLRENGFVESYRGPGGGYRLNRRLAAISVADIIVAVDSESFERDSSSGDARGPEGQASVAGSLWSRVDDHLREYLRSVTLESVLADAREAGDFRQGSAVPAMATCAEVPRPGREFRPTAAIAQAGALV